MRGRRSLTMARAHLGHVVQVVVDRPLGSHHPDHGFEYLANYGYLPGTTAPDGEELDAYYLGVGAPLTSAEGICIAIIHRYQDDDDKLVVVPLDQATMTDEQITAQIAFQEIPGAHEVIRTGTHPADPRSSAC